MWNKPTEKQLAKLPALYSGEGVALKDKKVMMHFFIGGCDWYATEYSPEDRIFFGFAILNGDLENAEWGNFSLDELIGVKAGFVEVDRDKYWKVRPASEVDKIKEAQGW